MDGYYVFLTGLLLIVYTGIVDSVCEDASVYCSWWARIGECTVNPCYMLPHCQSSCKDCNGEVSLGSGLCSNSRVECPCWAFYGRCNDPAIQSQCKKSCDTMCGEGGRDPAECVDDVQLCSFWAAVGECENNPGYMLYICKLSCQQCTVTTPAPLLRGSRQGTVVLRDDFDGATLNEDNWEYEISMFGGYNWEIQVYTKDSANVFLRDGKLYLKPTLTAYDPKFSESYLTNGTMNVTALWGSCTNSDNWGCVREGKYGLLPPVMSGKLKSKVDIKYGKIEVRAKIPKGDWIWPAKLNSSITGSCDSSDDIAGDCMHMDTATCITEEPQQKYRLGTPSGCYPEPILMVNGLPPARSTSWSHEHHISVVGNTEASDGTYNHGVNQVSSTLHWGPNASQNRFMKTHGDKDNAALWSSDFHIYTLDWDADKIVVSVDGEEVNRVPTPADSFWNYGEFSGPNIWATGGKNAPFDQAFYLMLNVAIGGTNGYFPDDWSYNTPKPYKNTSPTENADFWGKRNDWMPTWVNDDVAMIVDYVEMTQYN